MYTDNAEGTFRNIELENAQKELAALQSQSSSIASQRDSCKKKIGFVKVWDNACLDGNQRIQNEIQAKIADVTKRIENLKKIDPHTIKAQSDASIQQQKAEEEKKTKNWLLIGVVLFLFISAIGLTVYFIRKS